MWILPILFFLCFVLTLLKGGADWRDAFIIAACIWGCLVTAFTEFLSLFDLLTANGLIFCWALAIAGVLFLFWRRHGYQAAWRTNYSFSIVETTLLSGLGFVCVATFITAIVAPPNNWDSMTYHMSRVMHWLQNGSVAHYPTNIIRQLELNPWAEFAITHFQALSGGDRYANLVQWFSMVGSIIGATLVARELGGDRRAQLFTAVTVGTIPMGILQASSTQNDYVVSFWLICFVLFCLRFFGQKELKWALMAGAVLGLAILTKGTAYIYALPFVFWLVITIIKSTHRLRRAVLLILAVGLPVLILNGGHYSRNFALFSNPLLSSDTPAYSNEVFTVRTTISNILRNIAIHFSTPIGGVNQEIESGIETFHNFLQININDRRTTYGDTTFEVPMLVPNEDLSGNLLHAALVIFSISLLFYRKRSSRNSAAITPYFLGVVAGFLIFCIILKWQPNHSRLHLPVFILSGPIIGLALGRLRHQNLALVISVVLLISSLPWTLWNISRSLIPRPTIILNLVGGSPLPHTILTADRIDQYFTNNPAVRESFIEASRIIRESGARNIGIKTVEDDWEYPLWVLVRGKDCKVKRIEHIDVKNSSGAITLNDFQPDMLVIYKERRPTVAQPDNAFQIE